MNKKNFIKDFTFEIVDIKSLNPYISECKIKAFYLGANRNGSYITQAVGNQLAASIYNSPIVGYYSEKDKDFLGHEEEIRFEDNDIKTVSLTVPFGVVTENKPVEWRTELINNVEKTYLICYGYLWTGRYPQLNGLVEKGFKGHSMELFPESVQGIWAKPENEEEEFFIFSEASISALCILGDAYEPCFEGSQVEIINSQFSLNDSFQKEFEAFIFELNKVLNNNEGGIEVMGEEKVLDSIETEKAAEESVEKTVEYIEKTIEEGTSGITEEGETEDFKKKEEVEEKTSEDKNIKDKEDTSKDKKDEEEKISDEEDNKKKTYTLTEKEHEAYTNAVQALEQLQISYNDLQKSQEVLTNSLNSFKEKCEKYESKQREELFEKFSMLDEESIKTLKEKQNDFSLEELDEKLSAMAFKQGISFNKPEKTPRVVLPIETADSTLVPAWLKAVQNRNN